jgi:hypothetical protein
MLRYMVLAAVILFGLPIAISGIFYGGGSVSPFFLILCVCIVLVERDSCLHFPKPTRETQACMEGPCPVSWPHVFSEGTASILRCSNRTRSAAAVVQLFWYIDVDRGLPSFVSPEQKQALRQLTLPGRLPGSFARDGSRIAAECLRVTQRAFRMSAASCVEYHKDPTLKRQNSLQSLTGNAAVGIQGRSANRVPHRNCAGDSHAPTRLLALRSVPTPTKLSAARARR